MKSNEFFLKYSKEFCCVMVVCVLGAALQNWLIIKDGFARIHGDMGDARFNHILLEYAYQTLCSRRSIMNFWNPDWLFFPSQKGLLYSDIMAGAAINYIPFRLFGLTPEDSYQGWFLTTPILNFIAIYFLLRRISIAPFSAMVGGWLFAFSMIRGAFLPHSQLMPHYYVVLGLHCALSGFRERNLTKKKLFSLASGMLVGLQFWVSYYNLWFFNYLIILTLIVAFIIFGFKTTYRAICREKILLLGFVFGFCILTAPLVIQYLQIQNIIGSRKWSEIRGFLPSFRAFFVPQPDAWMHQWLVHLNLNRVNNFSEKYLFVGFTPLILVLTTLISLYSQKLRKKPWVIAGFVWFVAMCSLHEFIWHKVFYNIPGASAIRSMGRLGIAGLLPLSLCAAGALNELRCFFEKRPKYRFLGRIFGGLIFIFIFLENGSNFSYGFQKTEHLERVTWITDRLDSGRCKAFYYSAEDTNWKNDLDAMWASIMSGVPTINGYSGNVPPGYREAGFFSQNNPSKEQVSAWLVHANSSINAEDVCLLRRQR